MSWLWRIAVLLLAVTVEVWLGYWLRIWGVVVPVTWIVLTMLCWWSRPGEWLWFFVIAGLMTDMVGWWPWVGLNSLYMVLVGGLLVWLYQSYLKPVTNKDQLTTKMWLLVLMAVGLAGWVIWQAVQLEGVEILGWSIWELIGLRVGYWGVVAVFVAWWSDRNRENGWL